MPDIDIDVKTSFDPMKVFDGLCTPASMLTNGKLTKHPCGVYFHTIPTDPHTGLSAMTYDVVEQLGISKIDFLHASYLNRFKSKTELVKASTTTPNWTLLQNAAICAQLPHVRNHGELLASVYPTSIDELADVLALIRPGKRHLVNKYVTASKQQRKILRTELYDRNVSEHMFKRSHAIAYAYAIVAVLNSIERGHIDEFTDSN